ncbi:MAG: polysaccharide biosynthesis/export family protein [Pseudomonadota bacterium]
MFHGRRLLGLCSAALISLSAAACTLPRSGPYLEEITADEQGLLPFDLIAVTPDVASITRVDESSAFAIRFMQTPPERTNTIARGDVIAITVWENIDEGLLSPQGIGATTLPNSQVDSQGFLFVPYVGAIRAEGRTMTQLREAIRTELSERTLNPQVDVFPVEAGGRIVSIQGQVNSPGLYPIEKPTERLLAMLARAGGVNDDPEIIRIKLRRGSESGVISVQDLYDRPENDIALRAGDALIAERDRRIFTALGAVQGPATVPFPTRDLSVARALGVVGGLVDATADPTGVFVFRVEPPEIADRLFPGRQTTEPTRVAYIIDLTEPGGLFVAADFMMRDQDTLYVTTAPFVRWQKVLQSIAPLVGFAGSARSLSGI